MKQKTRRPTEEEHRLLREAVFESKQACSGSDALAIFSDFPDALRKAILDKFGECDLVADGMMVNIIKRTPDEKGLHMKAELHF